VRVLALLLVIWAGIVGIAAQARMFMPLQVAPSWVLPGAALDFYFARNQYWLAGQTFTYNTSTFQRATTGYWQDSTGLWKQFASNVPRITDLGLVMEASTINRALWSRDLTHTSNWTRSNLTPTLSATGVDGLSEAGSTLTATSGNGSIIQSVVLTSGPYTASAFVKRRTGSGIVNITVDSGTTCPDAVVTWRSLSAPGPRWYSGWTSSTTRYCDACVKIVEISRWPNAL